MFASTSKTNQWIIGLLLIIALCLLRFPWLEADVGNQGMWTFGYFNTDEGAYTGAGRSMYLNRPFYDSELLESPTISTSFGMHLVSYVGYAFGGLNYGAIRWPVMTSSILAWTCIYLLASRITLPLLAGLIVLLISSNPISLTYERSASTDILMGSLCVLSIYLSTNKKSIPIILGGITLALALTVKFSAIGLMPIALTFLLSHHKTSKHNLVYFYSAFFISLFILIGAREYFISSISEFDILSGTDKLSGLLTIDLAECFQHLLNFPPYPVSIQLGLFPILILVLPIGLIIHSWKSNGRVSRMSALSLGILLYFGLYAIQGKNPLRYILPLFYFIPLLLIYARRLNIKLPTDHSRRISLAIFTAFFFYWVISLFYSNRYKGIDSEYFQSFQFDPMLIIFHAIGFLIPLCMLIFKTKNKLTLKRYIGYIFVSLTFSCLFFSNYSQLTSKLETSFIFDQLLLQVSTLVIFSAILVKSFRFWKMWYLSLLIIFVIFSCANTFWRRAYEELSQRNYQTKAISSQLQGILPPNTIVIGRRASTLLRDSSFRLGLSNTAYEPKIWLQKVDHLLRRYPDQPLFWMCESSLFLKQGKMFNTENICTLSLPSDHAARKAETIFIVRIKSIN